MPFNTPTVDRYQPAWCTYSMWVHLCEIRIMEEIIYLMTWYMYSAVCYQVCPYFYKMNISLKARCSTTSAGKLNVCVLSYRPWLTSYWIEWIVCNHYLEHEQVFTWNMNKYLHRTWTNIYTEHEQIFTWNMNKYLQRTWNLPGTWTIICLEHEQIFNWNKNKYLPGRWTSVYLEHEHVFTWNMNTWLPKRWTSVYLKHEQVYMEDEQVFVNGAFIMPCHCLKHEHMLTTMHLSGVQWLLSRGMS